MSLIQELLPSQQPSAATEALNKTVMETESPKHQPLPFCNEAVVMVVKSYMYQESQLPSLSTFFQEAVLMAVEVDSRAATKYSMHLEPTIPEVRKTLVGEEELGSKAVAVGVMGAINQQLNCCRDLTEIALRLVVLIMEQ